MDPFEIAPFDDFTFPPAFRIAPGDLPPGVPSRVFYYPGADATGGRDGIILEVDPPEMERWTGVFARGLGGDPARSVLTLPGGERFLVACNGAGYIVHAEDPNDWAEVACTPVRGVLPVPAYDLVLVWDFTTLAAYDRDGLRWQTDRLVWDWLSILDISEGYVLAQGFNAPMDRDDQFRVEISSGRAVGQPYS